MWTPTFGREGVREYETAYRLVSEFLHRRGRDLGLREYVAVAELHPGGHGWHWHILLPHGFNKRELRELQRSWSEHCGRAGLRGAEGSGLVRHHVKRWSSAKHAAAYAAKYVTKTFDAAQVPAGRKRYLRSLGLSIPAAVVREGLSFVGALESLPEPGMWERFWDLRARGIPALWMITAET